MLIRPARPSRSRDHDAGVTLIEMVVGMTLALAVGALATNWFVSAGKTTDNTTAVSQATADARGTLQSWSAYLQLAASPAGDGSGTGRIVSVSPTSIDFYANLNNASCASNTTCAPLSPTEITLSLAAKNLVEKVGTRAATTVLPGAGVTATPCLFTVWSNGTSLGCQTTLTRAQLDSATGVSLAFAVQPVGGSSRSYATSGSFTTYAKTGNGS